MTGFTPSGNQVVGVTGYLEQYANEKDLGWTDRVIIYLRLFMTKYVSANSSSKFKFVSVNKGKNPQTPGSSGTEAALDIQYVTGLTYPSRTIFYSTAGSPPFKPDS